MGSQNSRNTEIESVSKPPENYENSINFLNSNNSIPSKKKIKSQYNNDYEIGEEENKCLKTMYSIKFKPQNFSNSNSI